MTKTKWEKIKNQTTTTTTTTTTKYKWGNSISTLNKSVIVGIKKNSYLNIWKLASWNGLHDKAQGKLIN